MLSPGSDHVCEGCAFLSDHVDAARTHFEHADLSFAAVSRAPLAQIERVKRRMGWRYRWVSSGGGDFNYNFGVSFTPEQVAADEVGYNYATTPHAGEDLHGASVFFETENSEVFHTYSTYARGAELLTGAFNWLDLAPRGRNERTIMDWVWLHDEYDAPAAAPCGCGAPATTGGGEA